MSNQSVDLFTKEEHAILSDWLGVDPKCEPRGLPTNSEALEKLGFSGLASGFTESDAAVASIVLERIQDRLPQWASVRVRESDEEELMVTLGRDVHDRRARRAVELVPQYLLTINWADSGPGFSWPVDYYATWAPVYDEYVVTQSADCPDAFGYCDFAIGHFPHTDNLVAEAAEVIKANWEWQYAQFDQSPWAYLFGVGKIDEDLAHQIRDHVWEDEL